MKHLQNLAPLLLTLLALTSCTSTSEGPLRGEAHVLIPSGSSFQSVSERLERAGIIRSPLLLRLYARWKGADRTVKPGLYAFKPGERWDSLLHIMAEGRVLRFTVVIPEGWTLTRIAERLQQSGHYSKAEIQTHLSSPQSAAEHGVPGPTLEGYLYPATYSLPVGTPLQELLQQMVKRYHEAWTPEMRARAKTLGMNEAEVTTLASIVEAEARVWEERPRIASVYLNRLRIGMPLQADPTVQYALQQRKDRLLYSDIAQVREHPYNTYHRRGLPPGPIGATSQGALRAVLWAETTPYLYFVARGDGRHTFSESYEGHLRAKREATRRRRAPS